MSLCGVCVFSLYSWGVWYCTYDGFLEELSHEYVHGLTECNRRRRSE